MTDNTDDVERESLVSHNRDIDEDADPDPSPLRNRQRYVYVLLLATISATWGRSLFPFLVNSLETGLHIDSTQFGFLAGYGIMASMVISGLFMGRLADHQPRHTLIMVSILSWSILTGLIGASRGFWSMFFLCLCYGLALGALQPASGSVISDLYPPHQRTFANAAIVSGIYIGNAFASLSGILSDFIGWRMTYVVCAVFGLVCLAVWMWACEEPERGGSEGGLWDPYALDRKFTMKETSRFILSLPTYRWALFGASMRIWGGMAIYSFLPLAFYRLHGQNTRELFDFWNAMALSGGGSLACFVGGWLIDILERRHKQVRAVIPAWGTALCIPFYILALTVSSFWGAIVCLFICYLFSEVWLGAASSIVQGLVPPGMVGMAMSQFMLVQTLIGTSSPLLVGFALDTFSPTSSEDHIHDPDAIRWILILVLVPSYLLAAVGFYLSGRYLRHDERAKEYFSTADSHDANAGMPLPTRGEGIPSSVL